MLLVDVDQTLLRESRQHAAHGFQLQTEEATDLGTRHPQNELGARVTARLEALRQVQQEGGEPLLSMHAAQQQHDAVLAHDLAAHHLVEVVAQHRHCGCHVLEAVVRDDADFGVLQRDGVARMRFSADAIEADQFTGHVKTGDLFASVLRHDGALQETEAHRVERFEAIAGAEQ